MCGKYQNFCKLMLIFWGRELCLVWQGQREQLWCKMLIATKRGTLNMMMG